MFTFHTNLNVHIPPKPKCLHSTQNNMFTFHTNLNVHIPHKPKCLHSTQTLLFAFHANLNVCIPCKPKCLHSRRPVNVCIPRTVQILTSLRLQTAVTFQIFQSTYSAFQWCTWNAGIRICMRAWILNIGKHDVRTRKEMSSAVLHVTAIGLVSGMLHTGRLRLLTVVWFWLSGCVVMDTSTVLWLCPSQWLNH